MFDLCFAQLIITACLYFVFLGAVIYMLKVNRCKFNKRTKVVICTMTVSMCFSVTSSSLTYYNSESHGECTIYPLPYSVQSENHVIIMIIYSFLVGRMLSIYHKMSLATMPIPNCKARQARRISQCQNPIVVVYFLTYTAFIWIFLVLVVYTWPKQELT